jgi:hypothetical protein
MSLIPLAVLIALIAAYSIRWNLAYWRASRAGREILRYGKPRAEMTDADWRQDAADRTW